MLAECSSGRASSCWLPQPASAHGEATTRLPLPAPLDPAPPRPSPPHPTQPNPPPAPQVRTETADFDAGLIFEQDPVQIVDALLPLYMNATLLRSLQEALASELAARMNAMNNASDNAGELKRNLTLVMNRKRQAKITTVRGWAGLWLAGWLGVGGGRRCTDRQHQAVRLPRPLLCPIDCLAKQTCCGKPASWACLLVVCQLARCARFGPRRRPDAPESTPHTSLTAPNPSPASFPC